MTGRHFGPRFFTFLRELKAHNDRAWFNDNKARYLEDVEAPMLQFIDDFSVRLRPISKRFVADPRRTGGSMFRIYRDTRFSEDKSPYKTHVAARFQHDAKGRDSLPGFYLHLAPGNSLAGGGIHRPDPASLRKIRQRIAGSPKEWKALLRSGLDIQGSTLKRVPAGFDADHPLAVDLKRKDHYVMESFTAKDVTSSDFLDRYVASCERVAPLVEFVTRAMGLRW
jgi:uncharacterized protein (TIGR02453 family)